MTESEWIRYLQKFDENYQARWDEVHRLYLDRAGDLAFTRLLSSLPQEEQDELYARLMIEFG